MTANTKNVFRKDRVTVYYWKPNNKLQGSVGHMAIQTHRGGKLKEHKFDGEDGYYISFYPKHTMDRKPWAEHNIFYAEEGRFVESKERDYREHKRHVNDSGEPDEVVELYDLDIDAINEAYEKIHEQSQHEGKRPNWSLWNRNGKSCSGLCSELLYQGGIIKRFNTWDKVKRGLLIGAGCGVLPGILYFILGYFGVIETGAKTTASSTTVAPVTPDKVPAPQGSGLGLGHARPTYIPGLVEGGVAAVALTVGAGLCALIADALIATLLGGIIGGIIGAITEYVYTTYFVGKFTESPKDVFRLAKRAEAYQDVNVVDEKNVEQGVSAKSVAKPRKRIFAGFFKKKALNDDCVRHHCRQESHCHARVVL